MVSRPCRGYDPGSMLFSQRFQLSVVITSHARSRMATRMMSEALVLDIIETGVDKDAGGGHHWL
jgi:hypothetical protein